MRIKVKTASATKVINIEDNLTYGGFIKELESDKDLFQNGESISQIKVGFPPKSIDYLSDNLIKDNIKNGEQIIIETSRIEGKDAVHKDNETKTIKKDSSGNDIPNVYIEGIEKYLILRNIPDDNSCMFNAIVYAIKDKKTVKELREVCSNVILSDPDKYSEAILGRLNEAYATWINKKDSWGGAIELGILSDYLDLRINCIDIELGSLIKFENEASKPTHFINLIYSGIHYDILSLNSILSIDGQDKKLDKNIWEIGSIQEDLIIDGSTKLVNLLQSRNYTTNTTTFRVRCLQCYNILVGENGATKHANETGHYRFGEVDDK